VLPIAAISVQSIAAVAKQTRESMLDVLSSEHIRMAWASGIPSRSIYFSLALKNAALPIVAVIGLQAVGLLGGTAFVEYVFALPGVGYLLVTSTIRGDVPIVQGVVILFSLIIVAINLLVDVVYSGLDPRVKTS